jgi:hypothetical protein
MEQVQEKPKEVKLNCEIPVSVKKRMKEVAAKHDMKMKDIAAVAIDSFLDELEAK